MGNLKRYGAGGAHELRPRLLSFEALCGEGGSVQSEGFFSVRGLGDVYTDEADVRCTFGLRRDLDRASIYYPRNASWHVGTGFAE